MFFMAFTQMGCDEIQHALVLEARYLTRMELNYSRLTTVVSIVGWVMRKLCQFIMFTAEVTVVVPILVDTYVVMGLELKIQLRVHVADLQQYAIFWVSGDNSWQAAGRAVEICTALELMNRLTAPYLKHCDMSFICPWHANPLLMQSIGQLAGSCSLIGVLQPRLSQGLQWCGGPMLGWQQHRHYGLRVYIIL